MKHAARNSLRYRRTSRGRFTVQRANARARGIAFNLTYVEWWQVWQESGHWAERGTRKDQYVMARKGDSGAYEHGNVYITTNGQNLLDAALNHAHPESAPTSTGEAVGAPF